ALARAGLPVLQRRVGGDARAQQRRGHVQRQLVRDPDDVVLIDHDGLRVAAVGGLPVLVQGVVGAGHALRAVLLLAAQAVLALAAEVDEAADADPVADRVPGDAGADLGDYAGDLVSGDHGEDRLARALLDLVDVGVADARVLDVDQDVELADRAALDGGALQRGLGRGRGVSGDSGHRWVLLGIGPRPVSL